MNYLKYVTCLIGLSGQLFAATAVASASSSAPFMLRGNEVSVRGVPSWPVFAGDEIIAGKAPVTLKFKCGSRVHLNPGTKANVSVDGENVVVHLLSGDLTYKVSKSCPLMIAGLDGKAVPATATSGSAEIAEGAVVLAPIIAVVVESGIGESSSNKLPVISPSR